MHRWGALYGGGMFTNVLLQAILYLRAAMLRGLAGRSDARLMAAIRVFIALECVGLVVLFYFMYDMAVLNSSSTTWTTRISVPRPAAASLGQYHHIRHDDLFRRRAHVRDSRARLRLCSSDAPRERGPASRRGGRRRRDARHLAPAEADGRARRGASLVAIMSTFWPSVPFPMIYGYVRPNFWRKRSMVFLVTFIVDSVVNDLCLMAVAFV